MLKDVLFSSTLSSTFIIKVCWIMSKSFSVYTEMTMRLFSLYVHSYYLLYFFTFLYLANPVFPEEVNLITVDNLLDIYLHLTFVTSLNNECLFLFLPGKGCVWGGTNI